MIYTNCRNSIVTSWVAYKIGANKKIIGVVGTDHGSFVHVLARQTTSFYIPTVTYIYNDEELMDQNQFPTLISLIPTKREEGKMISSFLDKMDFRFMDIWYHELSTKVAGYLFDEYLPKKVGGCGRSQQLFRSAFKNGELLKSYYNSTVKPASVQVLLTNSKSTSFGWLKNVTTHNKFRDKIYVMGSSNGRAIFHKEHEKILKSLDQSDDTIVYPLLALSNSQLTSFQEALAAPWEESEDDLELDNLYRYGQELAGESDCVNSSCRTTSWSPHVIAGSKIIVRALQEVLERSPAYNSEDYSVTSLRKSIFQAIVDEGKEIEVQLDDNVDLKIRFKGRTISTPTQLKVYRRTTDKYYVLGEISPDSIQIANKSLLREISYYDKRCSLDCQPGTYRTYESLALRAELPCCWQCKTCPPNQFSNTTNQNICHSCKSNEMSSPTRTECNHVNVVYIRAGSNIFLAGLALTVSAIAMIILIGILIWRNKKRPVIKASDPVYLYTILLSIAIGICGSFMPLLKPSQAVCTSEYVIAVISLTLITTNLLWKCIKIHAIFAAANSFQRPKFEIALKKAGQVFLNGVSLAFVVVFLLADGFGTGPGWTFHNFQEGDHEPIYPRCDLIDDYRGVMCTLPMIIPLLYFLATLVFVFKMRKFPHNFRETLNILVASLMVTFCCVMFLSGYNVSPPETKALLRAVVLFVTNMAFLLCLFLPRVVILLKKDVDTEREKQMITESLHAFAEKTSKRVSQAGSPRGRISVITTVSAKMAARKSIKSKTSPGGLSSVSTASSCGQTIKSGCSPKTTGNGQQSPRLTASPAISSIGRQSLRSSYSPKTPIAGRLSLRANYSPKSPIAGRRSLRSNHWHSTADADRPSAVESTSADVQGRASLRDTLVKERADESLDTQSPRIRASSLPGPKTLLQNKQVNDACISSDVVTKKGEVDQE